MATAVKVVLICECGRKITTRQQETYNKTNARMQASLKGWEHVRVGNQILDFCPRCYNTSHYKIGF